MKKTTDSKLKSKINDDIRFSRCSGLIHRTALKRFDNTVVSANQVKKSDGPFYCPECLSNVIVRKCSEKVDHFAHSARTSPVLRTRDSLLHDKCKDIFLEALKSKYPEGKWQTEREIPEVKEKGFKRVVPDISGRINGVPVAIEVQLSPYTINRISEKLIEYNKRKEKIAVLYIVPLYEEIGEEPFRPRLYEKYLHSLYYGRVYYWYLELETKLLPVHYSPTKRWIEESSWYNSEGEEESAGGYYLTYRTIKKPRFGKLVNIWDDFVPVNKPEFATKNQKKAIPECKIYKDRLESWWEHDEYKDTEKQFVKMKEEQSESFLHGYKYVDEYDEINI
jgi:hypothetical protein